MGMPWGFTFDDKHIDKSTAKPNTVDFNPAKWLVAVGSGILLLGLSKLVRTIRPAGNRNGVQRADRLPTHVLMNNQGVEVHVSPVGCAIERLLLPDRNGRLVDVVLGFDSEEPYLDDTNPYFGVVVGRCANRIASASFTIDGRRHKVTANDGRHALHGGAPGWGQKVWTAEKTIYEDNPAVRLTYTSNNGDQGYPGTVVATVTYVLTEGTSKTESGLLRCIMEATTDAPTPVNMAQHTYWNLAGHDSGNILGHMLMINAERYTPTDETSIPTGRMDPVKGTPFDFMTPKKIGARIQELPGGYDHNYVLNSTVKSKADPTLKVAALLQDPASGRAVQVATSAPGLQFYSGNFLDGSVVGKGGTAYAKHSGLALETQGFPNAINQPKFPPVLLRPDSTYCHEVTYTFRTK